jgi:hypothetical protein
LNCLANARFFVTAQVADFGEVLDWVEGQFFGFVALTAAIF